MNLFPKKKVEGEVIAWKRVLNVLYQSEGRNYILEYKIKSSGQFIEQPKLRKILGELDQMDNHPLAKDAGVSGKKLLDALIFLENNNLIDEGVRVIAPNADENDFFIITIVLNLTKKGFQVALNNEEKIIATALSLMNVSFIGLYTLLTALLVMVNLVQILLNLKIIQPIYGVAIILIGSTMITVAIFKSSSSIKKTLDELI